MGKGQLTFKGEEPKKKKKKSSKHRRVDEVEQQTNVLQDGNDQQIIAAAATAAVQRSTPTSLMSKPDGGTTTSTNTPTTGVVAQIRTGTGTITTSGTVVTGYETRFEREINVGDAIIVNNEMRIVTMRLSNISINVSTPYTTSYPTPVSFQYIPKPRSVVQDTVTEQARIAKQFDEIRRHAFDNYYTTTSNDSTSTNTTTTTAGPVVYRERTEHGSYRIKTMKLDTSVAPTTSSDNKRGNNAGSTSLSRTDLLVLRSKKTSDKYC